MLFRTRFHIIYYTRFPTFSFCLCIAKLTFVINKKTSFTRQFKYNESEISKYAFNTRNKFRGKRNIRRIIKVRRLQLRQRKHFFTLRRYLEKGNVLD